MSTGELSSADIESVSQLVTSALSAEDGVRLPAEQAIHSHLTHRPAAFLQAVLHLLLSSHSQPVRCFAAVLLRTKLTSGEPLLYESLPEQLQAALKSCLLQQLVSAQEESYVKGLIGDAVAELASVLLYQGEWEECVPFLAAMVERGYAQQAELALTVLSRLTDTLDTLLAHLPLLSPLLASSLSHPSTAVQTAAIHCLCKLLGILEDERQRKEHSKAFAPILSVLLRLVLSRQEEEAVKVLTSLVELLGEGDGNGLLMKPVMDKFAMLTTIVIVAGTPVIASLPDAFPPALLSPFAALLSSPAAAAASSSSPTAASPPSPSALSSPSSLFGADLRHLCMEFLVSLSEDQPRLVRRSKSFITASLLSAFALLLDVDATPLPVWAQQTDDEEEDGFDVGLVACNRLAEAVKGAKLTPVLLPFFHSLMAQQAWQYQHAALRMLANTAAVLPFEEIPIPVALSSLSSPHPRVRYAAVECIGQLAEDFRPHLQEQWHEQAFSKLVPCLVDPQWPRLQSHACLALFNLCVELEEATMARYSAPLLDTLLQLLTGSVRMVQEQVLATIAAIATAAPDAFEPWYPRVVPLIKHVIVEARGRALAMLRARAMESLTVIGMGVRKELFRDDAIHLMHIFLNIMANGDHQPAASPSASAAAAGDESERESERGRMGLAVDDVSEQFMLTAWTRIATVLGEEFSPMLERLLPQVFASASQRVDVVLRREELEGEDGRDEFSSSLEDKGNALAMLTSFCHDLTVGFFPYVQQTAAIALPLLSFPLSAEIRSYAITLMPLLVTSAVTAFRQGRTELAFVSSLLSAIVGAFRPRFAEEDETELLEALVSALKDCVTAVKDSSIARDCIDSDTVSALSEALLRMLASSRQRISQRERRMEEEEEDEEGMDEDSMLTMEAAIHDEDALHVRIADCIGTLIQSHGSAFLPTFRRLCPELLSLLQHSAPVNSRRVSVFLFDDLMEYAQLSEQQEEEQLMASFMPHLLAYVALYPAAAPTSPSSPQRRQDANLRQACAYGIGVCAAQHPIAFLPYADRAIAALVAVIDDLPARLSSSSSSSSPTSTSDVDNCISALGKIATMTLPAASPSSSASSSSPHATVAQPYSRLLSRWLYALPLRDDEDEGVSVYGLLVRLLEQHHAAVFVDDAHVLQVLFVLSSVVHTPFVNDELRAKMVQLLRVMKREGYGDGRKGSRLMGLAVEQRQKVVEVLEAM